MTTIGYGRFRKGTGAALLALWILTPFAGASIAATASAGAIRGILYKADETTRLAAATVTAINVKTGRRYVSNHTGDNGAYEITGLPAGTYDIAIDVAEHVFVTDNLIDLAENQRLYLSFAVSPKGAVPPGTAEPPNAKGEAKMTFTDPSAVPQTAPPAKKKGFWSRPGGIAIISILVVGAFGAGVAAQNN